MKRIIFLVVMVLFMSFGFAQGITDGVRYALDGINGTARFNAMSGAFGALGGDFSAFGINPAGSAVFLQNSSSVSMVINDKSNKATYFGTSRNSGGSDVNFSQVGFVFVFNKFKTDSKWKKITLGFNYDATHNFDDQLFIQGTGNTSIGEFFLSQAQGIPLDLLQLQDGESISSLYRYLGETQGVAAQNGFLGYQGFIIDPVDPDNPNNSAYFSNIAPGNFGQNYSLYSSGYGGKYTMNFAAQYTDKFFFGINLNSHSINYFESTFLRESNTNKGSLVNQVGFENNLSVNGYGFSAQFGAIAKLTNELRVGLTYDTPTWYNMYEETSQYLETRRTEDGESIFTVVDPRILNVFARYELRTPGKFSASSAYIFGKNGLISFDYSYKDFGQIRFSPTNDPTFANENNKINNRLKGVSSFRIGGEYRISYVSLRGGFRYEDSPYKDGNTVGDLNGFSLGIGYNFGIFNFDFAYSHAEQNRRHQLYHVGLTDFAMVNTKYNNYVFTAAFSL